MNTLENLNPDHKTEPIYVDIWSDIICPFCYIGKRHLESALKKFPDQEVEFVWKSFQLNPEIPEKVDQNVYEYLAEVKGLSVEDLASARNVASSTVKVQLSSIYKKFGVKSRSELLAILLDEYKELNI